MYYKKVLVRPFLTAAPKFNKKEQRYTLH